MDTELLRIAALHGGVILRPAALERGYSAAAIDRRLDGGLLVPIFPGAGAYVLASTPIERRHRVIAATLLTPGAAADANDAAVLLGLLPRLACSASCGSTGRNPFESRCLTTHAFGREASRSAASFTAVIPTSSTSSGSTS